MQLRHTNIWMFTINIIGVDFLSWQLSIPTDTYYFYQIYYFMKRRIKLHVLRNYEILMYLMYFYKKVINKKLINKDYSQWELFKLPDNNTKLNDQKITFPLIF